MDKRKNGLIIRPVSLGDASAVTEVINSVVKERKFTTFSKMSEKEGRQYIKSIGHNETILIAELGGKIVGFQFFEVFPGGTEANKHVGTMGIFLLKGYRERGIGPKLAERTFGWAKRKGFEKVVTWVFEDNVGGLRFYKRLGFKPVGKWKKQVKIGRDYHNEIVLEKFL
jgi:GNAT superfamily N-acetyltransferase